MPISAKRFQPIPFFIHILIPLGIGGLGSLLTKKGIDNWYPYIAKPSFNPPNWLFAPVWTTIFVLVGTAAYLVWIKREKIPHLPRTIAIYFIQLILNLVWSFLFFYNQLIGAALMEMVVLLFAIALNGITFFRIDRIAGLLFIPYFLWVSFATLLTYTIFTLN